jgi:hypothetical protein
MTDTSTSTTLGDARWWLGGLAVIKATAASTGGQLTIIEVTEPVGRRRRCTSTTTRTRAFSCSRAA